MKVARWYQDPSLFISLSHSTRALSLFSSLVSIKLHSHDQIFELLIFHIVFLEILLQPFFFLCFGEREVLAYFCRHLSVFQLVEEICQEIEELLSAKNFDSFTQTFLFRFFPLLFGLQTEDLIIISSPFELWLPWWPLMIRDLGLMTASSSEVLMTQEIRIF